MEEATVLLVLGSVKDDERRLILPVGEDRNIKQSIDFGNWWTHG